MRSRCDRHGLLGPAAWIEYHRKQVLTSARRLIVILCLAAILFAALTPVASHLLFAILAPLWFFFSILVSISIRTVAGERNLQRFLFRPILASRPPPVG